MALNLFKVPNPYNLRTSRDKWFLRMGSTQILFLNSRTNLAIHITLSKSEEVLNSFSLIIT